MCNKFCDDDKDTKEGTLAEPFYVSLMHVKDTKKNWRKQMYQCDKFITPCKQ